MPDHGRPGVALESRDWIHRPHRRPRRPPRRPWRRCSRPCAASVRRSSGPTLGRRPLHVRQRRQRGRRAAPRRGADRPLQARPTAAARRHAEHRPDGDDLHRQRLRASTTCSPASCEALARPGDVVAAFTTSGASPNVVDALRAAQERGATTVLFGGGDGGPAAGPRRPRAARAEHRRPPRIQEMHTFLLHADLRGRRRLGRRHRARCAPGRHAPERRRGRIARVSPAPLSNAPSGPQPGGRSAASDPRPRPTARCT